ncbi:hypothetical protein GOV09_06950 [Candidatus Woesearchaeota archaeon]|nr:hypothetical protein [Candidatus Woesearchaeota archaeon]
MIAQNYNARVTEVVPKGDNLQRVYIRPDNGFHVKRGQFTHVAANGTSENIEQRVLRCTGRAVPHQEGSGFGFIPVQHEPSTRYVRNQRVYVPEGVDDITKGIPLRGTKTDILVYVSSTPDGHVANGMSAMHKLNDSHPYHIVVVAIGEDQNEFVLEAALKELAMHERFHYIQEVSGDRYATLSQLLELEANEIESRTDVLVDRDNTHFFFYGDRKTIGQFRWKERNGRRFRFEGTRLVGELINEGTFFPSNITKRYG